jgi:hypothetical protein
VKFNAASLSSGVYFCRMRVSDAGNGRVKYFSTRKMLLTK